MAQHNTDYGLVYNTDGSLCVTKRTDIVPFPGITSYAVETATTNLIGHTNGRFNLVAGGGTTPPTVELVSKKTPWGNEAWKVTIPANNTLYGGCHIATNDTPIVADGYYSYFTYVLFEGSLKPSDIYIYATGSRGLDGMVLDSSKNIGMWQRFSRKNVHTLQGYYHFTYYLTTTSTVARTFYIAVGQFEQKPFCSSFVNGYRQEGRLAVEPEDLGFNPGTDDWVVSYRKYPIATENNTLTDYNLNSFGDISDGYYIYWGKDRYVNQYTIWARYNDGTTIQSHSPTFNPDDYFRHWHSEVILRHGNVIEYWIDGVLQCQATLTKSLPNYGIVGLSLGGYRGTTPNNALIANIAYGKYTDQWTPEYIQRISAMTSTFYVPTKRVIV